MRRDECIKSVPSGWRVLSQDEVIRNGDRGWFTDDNGDDMDGPMGGDELWGWEAMAPHLGLTVALAAKGEGFNRWGLVVIRQEVQADAVLHDPEAVEALRVLMAKGYTVDEICAAMERVS